jgi:hypothetical protein
MVEDLYRRRAEIGVSTDLLADVLGLSNSTRIIGAGWDATHGCIRLVIAHPALPVVAEGQMNPTASVDNEQTASPRWVKAAPVTTTLHVNGADVKLGETMVERKD